MDDRQINKILIEYDSIIKHNVKKLIKNNSFLDSRCITVDDIIQEVRIRIWQLLQEKYNAKYDLGIFIGYQSDWNAKRIMNNLYRTSTTFTSCLKKKQGKGPHQAMIDNSKDYFSDLEKKAYMVDDFDKSTNKLDIILSNNDYEFYGFDIDYNYLKENVYKKINTSITQNSAKVFYTEIFDLIVDNPVLFSEKNLYKEISKKYDYTVDAIRLIHKQLIKIVYSVIEEYNQE